MVVKRAESRVGPGWLMGLRLLLIFNEEELLIVRVRHFSRTHDIGASRHLTRPIELV